MCQNPAGDHIGAGEGIEPRGIGLDIGVKEIRPMLPPAAGDEQCSEEDDGRADEDSPERAVAGYGISESVQLLPLRR